MTATRSGNQPPCRNFVRFAAKNSSSIARKKPEPVRTIHSGRPHWYRAMYATSRVVIVMVPVTAIPNAKASAVDDLNANTRPSTETISAQFTQGT